MSSSNQDKFRRGVRDLNSQFEDWIRETMRTNKSASLRHGILEYTEKLQELEEEFALCAGGLAYCHS